LYFCFCLTDEQAACDALQTLAEMSLMMPYLSAEGGKHLIFPLSNVYVLTQPVQEKGCGWSVEAQASTFS